MSRAKVTNFEELQSKALAAGKRSKEMRDALLLAEGGAHSCRDLARALSISHATVVCHEKKGDIFSVPRGRSKLYPIWQFDNDGRPYPGIKAVLSRYYPTNPFALITFFLNTHHEAGGARPLDWVKDGRMSDLAGLADLEAHR